jgi:hypothetical protein
MSLIVRVWCGVEDLVDWSLWYGKAGTVLWQKSRGVVRSCVGLIKIRCDIASMTNNALDSFSPHPP